MGALGMGEERAAGLLAGIGGAEIAAVNGPSSVVVSGTAVAVAAAVAAARAAGARATRLKVSHAFHSMLTEPVLGEFGRVLEQVAFAPPALAGISNVTGALAAAGQWADPGYWVRHVRRPVRFAAGVAAARAAGAGFFLELGPDGVLTALAAEITAGIAAGNGAAGNGAGIGAAADGAGAGHGGGGGVVCVAGLRRGRGEAAALLGAAGELWRGGVGVDWAAVLAGAGRGARVDLPTYAFQRERFWLAGPRGGDVSAWGLGAVGHPLLGAAVELPDGGVVLSGRLSVGGQPWLADHRVLGQVVVPGAALAEMVIRAGDLAGVPVLGELVIAAPLVLAGAGGMQVRVSVAGPDADGRCAVAVHARAEDGEAGWTCHASGSLAPAGAGEAAAATADLATWPPPGAVPVPVAGVYEELAGRGLEYGPAFRGLRAVWARGAEVFAEAELPSAAGGDGFGVHPALLDAALHACGFCAGLGGADGAGPLVPFAWSGVRLHATGAVAARVRIVPAGDGAVRMELADAAGDLVASVDSLVLRPAQAARVPGADEGLWRLDWVLVPVPAGVVPGSWAVAGADRLGLGGPAWDGGPVPELVVWAAPGGSGPGGVRAAAAGALGVLQAWLGAGPGAGARLVMVTVGGVCAGPGEAAGEAAAAVCGLVRAAQAEHPGRIVLVDAPGGADAGLLAGLAGLGEPQLAVRGGEVWVPRLAAMAAGASLPLDPGALPAPVRVGMRDGEAGNLRWLAGDGADPGPGQIGVAVRAAGLNFRTWWSGWAWSRGTSRPWVTRWPGWWWRSARVWGICGRGSGDGVVPGCVRPGGGG